MKKKWVGFTTLDVLSRQQKTVPANAKILSVSYHEKEIRVYMILSPIERGDKYETRTFAIHTTGQEFTDSPNEVRNYLGTIEKDSYHFHVFEITTP